MSVPEANSLQQQESPDALGAYPLIGPDDPPPYSTFNDGGGAPLLLVCDHASRAFPRSMHQLGVADWVLDKHVAWDIGSDLLTKCLARHLDAPAVLANYSRLIVDLNRKLHDPSAFIKVSDGIAIPGNLDISPDEREQRIQSFFNPYHAAIERRLEAFRAGGIVPALISIHTCTPVFNRIVRQMHIGIMWDKDPRIPRPLMDRLAQFDGISLGDNEPYSGRHPRDFTVDYHAERTGLPCVGIEVRQDLVDTPEGAEHWAGLLGEALQDVLTDPSIFAIRPDRDPERDRAH